MEISNANNQVRETAIEIGTVDEASQRGALDYLFPDAQWSGNLTLPYRNHIKPTPMQLIQRHSHP